MIKYQELSIKYYNTNEHYIIRGLLETKDNNQDLAVLLHGFTGHKNENGFLLKNLSNILCANNISSLRFDYYGSGDSDGEFLNQSYRTVLNDAKAILEYAYRLNNNKPVILIGFSMGGSLAARLSSIYPDIIKKLVLISPASNMLDILSRSFKDNNLEYIDYGGYYISRDYYNSLIDYDMFEGLENYKNKCLIIQGASDQSVNPKNSLLYTKYYYDVSYITIESAPHCYTKVEYRKALYNYILDFLL